FIWGVFAFKANRDDIPQPVVIAAVLPVDEVDAVVASHEILGPCVQVAGDILHSEGFQLILHSQELRFHFAVPGEIQGRIAIYVLFKGGNVGEGIKRAVESNVRVMEPAQSRGHKLHIDLAVRADYRKRLGSGNVSGDLKPAFEIEMYGFTIETD